jgi:hypothetical protein
MVDTRDKKACPSALLDTDAGLIVAWYELASTNEMLGLIDLNSDVMSMQIGQVPTVDSPDMALVSLGSQTYLAHVRWTKDNPETVISSIDWSKGLTEQSVTPGYFSSFFAMGNQLVLGMQDSQQMTLYAATPGEQPSVWLHEPGGSLAAADACGRVVALGDGGPLPAGIADGFFAQPLEPAGAKVDLGGLTEAAIAAAGAQFGVLWYERIGPPGIGPGTATGTLNFATLSWH